MILYFFLKDIIYQAKQFFKENRIVLQIPLPALFLKSHTIIFMRYSGLSFKKSFILEIILVYFAAKF